jgi:molecular chaperone GrpE
MAKRKQQAAPDQQTSTTAELNDGAEDALDLLRRERADFLNYKRRVEREQAEDREWAAAEVLERLLPLLDDLDRALAQIPSELEAHPWAQGAALSRRKLTEALGDLGVERIGAEGEPFDPARHEAIFYDARPDATDRTVTAVTRAGYRRGERLLQPAQVAVVGPAENRTIPAAQEGGAEYALVTSKRAAADIGVGG